MSSTGTVTAANTFGPNGLVSRRVGATTTFYTFDNRGNVAQRLDSNGAVISTDVYDAYGKRSSPTAQTDPFGYGGQYGYYTDTETGLQYLTNRYYDANAGRFLTRDPAGYDGGINLYGYVGNNPANGADPLGLSTNDSYWEQSLQFARGVRTSFDNQTVSWVFGDSLAWQFAKSVAPADQAAQMAAMETPFRTDCSEEQKDGSRLGDALGVAFAILSLRAGGGAAAASEKGALVAASTKNRNTVVIGQNMRRVKAFAKANGYGYYSPKPRISLGDLSLARNERWIDRMMREGREIIDIGHDVDNPYYNATHYNMEKDATAYYDYLRFLPQP